MMNDMMKAFGHQMISCSHRNPGTAYASLPFSLHHLMEMVLSMTAWLKLDAKNMIVFHCVDGKQRSGRSDSPMISSLLSLSLSLFY